MTLVFPLNVKIYFILLTVPFPHVELPSQIQGDLQKRTECDNSVFQYKHAKSKRMIRQKRKKSAHTKHSLYTRQRYSPTKLMKRKIITYVHLPINSLQFILAVEETWFVVSILWQWRASPTVNVRLIVILGAVIRTYIFLSCRQDVVSGIVFAITTGICILNGNIRQGRSVLNLIGQANK